MTLQFQNANISGQDYSNRNDLAGVTFQGALCVGTNFTNSDLAGANFTGANLTDALLAGANCSGANFTGATLDGATCRGASFYGATLTNADIGNVATLQNANLAYAAWTLGNAPQYQIPAPA